MFLINIRLNKSVPDCYKNKNMCKKAIDNHPHALEFVPECFKTQKMCDKAVDSHPPTLKYVPECSKTQNMYYRAVHRCFCF